MFLSNKPSLFIADYSHILSLESTWNTQIIVVVFCLTIWLSTITFLLKIILVTHKVPSKHQRLESKSTKPN